MWGVDASIGVPPGSLHLTLNVEALSVTPVSADDPNMEHHVVSGSDLPPPGGNQEPAFGQCCDCSECENSLILQTPPDVQRNDLVSQAASAHKHRLGAEVRRAAFGDAGTLAP
jgi:hypothetical protein